jgi:hypothetical protein
MVMVAAACSGSDNGSGGGSTAEPSGSSTAVAEGTLGDPTTVDPCSWVDVDKLEASGQAGVAVGNDFSSCIVEYRPSGGGAPVWTTLSFTGLEFDLDSYTAQYGATTDQVGPSTIVSAVDPGSGVNCVSGVFTADRYFITLSGVDEQGQVATQPVCSVLTDMATNVAQTLNAGKVRHREYPDNSMAKVDGCSLLSPEDLTAALPGSTLEQVSDAGPGQGCSWMTPHDDQGDGVSVGFITQLSSAVPVAGEGDEETTIAGWKTFIWQDGEGVPGGSGPTRCVAMAVGSTWPDELVNYQGSVTPTTDSGELLVVELPTLTVRGQLPYDQLCSAVRSLAEAAWQGIPK